ncbi:hypothetical protein M9458_050625, partial [Cirrhinus mrigala]
DEGPAAVSPVKKMTHYYLLGGLHARDIAGHRVTVSYSVGRKNQQNAIKDYLGGESDEPRDVFLIIIEYLEELDTFITNGLHEQGLKVHAIFCE